MLDGQPISPQEREKAHQRFHMGTPSHLLHLFYLLLCFYNLNTFCAVLTEEVERLEQELELRAEEIAQLQRERTTALEELERQETVNQNLRQQHQEQQRSREELRRELDTKSELVGDGVFTVICPSVNRVNHFVLQHNCNITCKQYFNFRAFLRQHRLKKKLFLKSNEILCFLHALVSLEILANFASITWLVERKVTITIRFYKGCF